MKKPRNPVRLICLLMASLFADPVFAGSDSDAGHRRIALRADLWFPVNGEPRAARPGFGIEILDAIWTSAGYQLDYRLMPWRRSLELVHAGKADCVIGAYLTDAPDMLYPLEPLAFDGIALYALMDAPVDYRGPDSLDDVKVGVIGGYSYGAEFDAWVDDRHGSSNLEVMQGSDALEKNIRKLLSGRLDVVVESPLVMQAKLEAMNLEHRIRRAATVTDDMPIFVACGPGRGARDWLEVYDRGIRQLMREDKLGDIYRRYGIDVKRQMEMRSRWPGRVPEKIAPPSPSESEFSE